MWLYSIVRNAFSPVCSAGPIDTRLCLKNNQCHLLADTCNNTLINARTIFLEVEIWMRDYKDIVKHRYQQTNWKGKNYFKNLVIVRKLHNCTLLDLHICCGCYGELPAQKQNFPPQNSGQNCEQKVYILWKPKMRLKSGSVQCSSAIV